MPRRVASNLDEEKRSYGTLWLVLSLLLFVGALWAVADDNLFRRPWKRYQAEFNRLEIRHIEDAIAAEQKRLDEDPAYKDAVKALADARASVTSGALAKEIADLEAALAKAKIEDQ